MQRRLVIAAVLVVGVGAGVVGSRAWLGSDAVTARGSSTCVPRTSDEPLLVGVTELDNTRPIPVRVRSVDVAGGSGLELSDDLWAKRLDPAGDTGVGATFSAADLRGYARVGGDGLVVRQGEEWSLVVGLVSRPAGGRLDGFDVVWDRGPFEYRSRSATAVTVVPGSVTCG